MKTYRDAVSREAAVALLVPSTTSRNTAEKYTTSSPICSMVSGEDVCVTIGPEEERESWFREVPWMELCGQHSCATWWRIRS